MYAPSCSCSVANVPQKLQAVIPSREDGERPHTGFDANFAIICVTYANSPSELFVTAACTYLPQLRLSRPGTCSRALRIAISETASTTHSKLAWPTDAASASGAGLQKSIASGTPSRIANSTVLRS